MKTGNRQQRLRLLALIVVALFIGDRLYAPLSALWKTRAGEIRKLSTQIRRGQGTIGSEQAIRGQWSGMRTNTLPNDQSRALERVSGRIRDWAEESGVNLNGVNSQWKGEGEDYKTLVCRVDVSGSLWKLSRFVYDIENDPLALKLESVDFSSKDATGQELSLGVQVSGLVLISQTQ